MPYSRPTLTELRAQGAADVNADLPSTEGLLRFSVLRIIVDVIAAMVSGFYGFLDWIAKQSVPFTATDEFLEAWAALRQVIRKPASFAEGEVRFTAAPGNTIPEGVSIQRSDGASFTTTAEASTVSNAITVPVIADVAGPAGNTDVGTPMSLASAISGVNGSGAVFADIVGGADVEKDEPLRSRMLAAWANPARGGSASDYEGWALAVPGVTRAWIKAGEMGPGTVTVRFMMDDVRVDDDGFPQGTNGVAFDEARAAHATGDMRKVADAIFAVQPVSALVYAVAPIANVLDITIAGLSGASNTTKDAIRAALKPALMVDATPGGTTALSTLDAAISGVPGSTGFLITNIEASAGTVSPDPVGNVTSDAGALAALGTVSFP